MARAPRPIIVLGPERSGTSVVADMICRWGAYPGRPDLLRKSDEQNPRGYFEYLPIWDFLDELGTNWWDEGFQEDLKEKAADAANREKAKAMISEMEVAGSPWIWKDPALSFFLPFWNRIWNGPIFVITVRNPLDTARSWHRFTIPPNARKTVDTAEGYLLRWHYIVSLIFGNTETAQSKIFLSFERLLTEPAAEATRLCSYLDAAVGIEEPDDRRLLEMSEAVDAGLWRNRSTVPFDETRPATPELKRLYRFAQAKIEDPSKPFRSSDYPLRPGWRRTVIAAEILAREHREAVGWNHR